MGCSAHSPTFPSLHLRHISFSNPSVALLILQPFRHFTYVTSHSPSLPSLCSFSNLSVTSHTSQLILQPFRRFAHSPTFPSLHLRHNSFSNPSVTSPTSQFILQPFFRFSYATSSSFNSPGEPPMQLNRNFDANFKVWNTQETNHKTEISKFSKTQS